MKKIIYIILLGIILNCNNSKSNADSQSELYKLTCENERELLTNPKNNWRIPLELINNINDYISESNVQLKSPNALNGIEKSEYGMSIYSNIFPYSKINGIEIGLMPLVRSTGSGFTSFVEDSFRIEIDEEQKSQLQLKQNVFEFYRNFKPNTEFDSDIRLRYPRIDLTFRGNTFYKMNDVLSRIALGYLEAAELKSEKLFSKNICELNKTELNKLKSDFELNIRIFKMGGIE
ncbi:hypothetical protein [Flavobacterium okayamense]|uniref:TolC family protein n=1 Tax=Flavobacterium okayamense TaxID=2830782 RepID=A0ABM7S7U6_9FLAO|nr:hypothetical protein [Flavobacterium okayamense]BCY28784.1 hypothetical protein KK2020170_16520 [Flavobacterium okayamense]